MKKFSEEQQKIIDLDKGTHACLASAGSGKTEILTERVRKAILEEGIAPEKIACLTFTNRAAKSMRNRIEDILGEESNNFFVGNCHALAQQLISNQENSHKKYFLVEENAASLIWKLAKQNTLKRIKKSLPAAFQKNGDTPDTDCTKPTQAEWNSRLATGYREQLIPIYKLTSAAAESLEKVSGLNTKYEVSSYETLTFLSTPENFEKNKSNKLFKLYEAIHPVLQKGLLSGKLLQASLEKIKTIDENAFSNISLLSILIGREYERLKDYLRCYDLNDALIKASFIKSKEIEWCQIDEFQDLSPVQWALIQHHLKDSAHVMHFGDLNQSIYRFIGASIEVAEDTVGNKRKELSKNFRSPGNLVRFFNLYSEKNLNHKFKKRVVASETKMKGDLIHLYNLGSEEQEHEICNYVKSSYQKTNIAILCPTNNDVKRYSKKLKALQVKHFEVSSSDILKSKPALDFISFVRAINDKEDITAWSRLFWNFGQPEARKESNLKKLPKQILSLKIASDLWESGGRLIDFSKAPRIYDHYLSSFCKAIDNGYHYFDTETTGLDFTRDKIIQIAAVSGGVNLAPVETNLYCKAEKPVGESEKIHGISDKYLQLHGKNIGEQIKIFFIRTKGGPLIAHNLSFDEKMLSLAILENSAHDFYEFLSSYRFCTLDISRRFFPNLKNHKLGNLLQLFSLQGENSHNALDDVKAGKSLAHFLRENISGAVNEIDRVIDDHENAFENFRKKFSPLFYEIEKEFLSNGEMTVEELIDLYFQYQPLKKEENERKEQLKEKLLPWSYKNYGPMRAQDLVNKLSKDLLTAKEPDLITEKDLVVVSTVHRAKGLEFDTVLMPEVVSASYPPYPVMKEKNLSEKMKLIDEQKRLLYVGITRAKNNLIIGTCNRVTRYNKITGDSFFIRTGPCEFISPVLNEMESKEAIDI